MFTYSSFMTLFFRSFGIHAKGRGERGCSHSILGVLGGRRTKQRRGPSKHRNERWPCMLLCLFICGCYCRCFPPFLLAMLDVRAIWNPHKAFAVFIIDD